MRLHPIHGYVLLCSRLRSFIVKTEFAPAHGEEKVPLQTTTVQEVMYEFRQKRSNTKEDDSLLFLTVGGMRRIDVFMLASSCISRILQLWFYATQINTTILKPRVLSLIRSWKTVLKHVLMIWMKWWANHTPCCPHWASFMQQNGPTISLRRFRVGFEQFLS
jgi:hypothetical protein